MDIRKYLSNHISDFLDGYELEPIENIRVLVLNFLAGVAYTNAKRCGGIFIGRNHDGENIIVMTKDFVEAVSPETVKVALWHEVGHNRAGDLDLMAAGKAMTFKGVALLNEKRADDLPISMFGKRRTFEGLMEIAAFFGRDVLKSAIAGKIMFWIFNPTRTLRLLF